MPWGIPVKAACSREPAVTGEPHSGCLVPDAGSQATAQARRRDPAEPVMNPSERAATSHRNLVVPSEGEGPEFIEGEALADHVSPLHFWDRRH